MHVVTLNFNLAAIEEVISKLAVEALNRQLAARLANDYAEEQESAISLLRRRRGKCGTAVF